MRPPRRVAPAGGGHAVETVRRTFRVTRGVVSLVAMIGLIVVIVRVHAWAVLVVVVGLFVALAGLEAHDTRAARSLRLREEDDP
jgi:uncharacterized membrane protein HdeD (DUF308 family)